MRFLFGCVGGLFALTSAQAADLPAKAKPVQYVKICSLYGAGFYYIPGTDTCLKVGGYVRAQAEWNSNNGVPFGSSFNGFSPSNISNALFDRASDSLQYTGRAAISADARSQTEYGTVRGYIRIGAQFLGSGESATFLADRAFIQFAGLTAGHTVSFFDIFSNTELFSYTNAKTSGDTYNYGIKVLAYTATLGNGVSATISAELPHYLAGVADGTNSAFSINGTTTLDTAGFSVPDFVGNVRLDQEWGYVGVSGAIHRVAGRYYGSGQVSHPEDKYGWAAQLGGLGRLPWSTTVGASFVLTKGAVGYATKAGSWQMYDGSTVGVGWVVDGLFDTNSFLGGNTPIHLTNAWSVNAGLEHMWNPRWRTSVYGGYTRVWYDADTKVLINTHLPGAGGSIQCGVPVAGSVWPPISVVSGGVGNSCSPDFSFYQIGSRTQWDISNTFYMGVDVTYTHLNTAYKGLGTYGGPRPATSLDDQGIWSAIFRMQYSFVP
jgi:hypothetical protein